MLPGFIASDNDGNTLTLGRGGSDLTASLLANYSNARKLEIWSDVSGMFTANPKLVSQALPIKNCLIMKQWNFRILALRSYTLLFNL